MVAMTHYNRQPSPTAPLVVTFKNQGVADDLHPKQTAMPIPPVGEATYEFTDDLSAFLGAR